MIPAAESIERKWREYRQQLFEDWQRSALNPHKPQTHGNFVRECAREAFGVKGRTREEVVAACLAARPDLYAKDGEDFVKPAAVVMTLPVLRPIEW